MKIFFSPAGKSAHHLPDALSGEPGTSQVSVHYCSCKAHNGESTFQGLSSKTAATREMQQHSQTQKDDRDGKPSRQLPGHGERAADRKLEPYCPRLPPASGERAVAPALLMPCPMSQKEHKKQTHRARLSRGCAPVVG